MRTQLDRQMLRPGVVSSYTDDFNQVNTDFIAHLRERREAGGGESGGSGDGAGMAQLDEHLFRWSLESKSVNYPITAPFCQLNHQVARLLPARSKPVCQSTFIKPNFHPAFQLIIQSIIL